MIVGARRHLLARLPAALAGVLPLAGAVILAAGCATGPRPLGSDPGALGPSAPDPTEALRAAAPDVTWQPLPVLAADLTGDGVTDQVYRGRTGGAVVLGLIAGPTTRPGPVRLIRLPVRPHAPGSLCRAEVTLTAETVHPPLAKLGCQGAGQAPGCTGVVAGARFARAHPSLRGVRVDDGRCPAFHVYWDPTASTFAWWRR